MWERIEDSLIAHGPSADQALRVLCDILGTNILTDAQRDVLAMQFDHAVDPANDMNAES